MISRNSIGPIFVFVVLISSARAGEQSSRREQAYRKLISANLALDQSLFGERNLREIRRLRRRADQYMLPLVVAIEARYAREMEKNPKKALELVVPLLFKDSNWVEKLHDAEKRRRTKYMERKRQAFRERKEVGPMSTSLAVQFPPASKATISELNGEVAMEVARALLEFGHVREALAYVDALGKDFPAEGRVRALECLGDVSVKLQMWDRAVDEYVSAKKLLRELKPSDGYSEMQKVLLSRIERKLKIVEQLRDIERYGKGYVLWREADMLRRKKKAYLEAIELYERIQHELPDTVYSSGARCHQILCLLELAKQKKAGEREEKTIAEIEKKLESEERFYRLARRCKVPKNSLDEIKSDIKKLEDRLEHLKKMPYAQAALDSAKELARDAIKKNMWGLWNGEILVAIADFNFDYELQPAEADRYYRQAWEWLKQASAHDAAVVSFMVPAKASSVSAPPSSVVKSDMFRNIDREEVPIGAITNRRTAPWYLDELRAKTVKAIGFICFAREDMDEALEWYAKIPRFDAKVRAHSEKGEWNDYKRLKWGAEHSYLYAFPQELKVFNQRKRFAVLLADFYFCTERFERAVALCDLILSGKAGRLSRAEKEYPRFLKGSATFWLKGREAAFSELEKVFVDSRSRSFTADRARYSAGNTIQGTEDEKLWLKGQSYLEDLAESRRDNIWIDYARLTYGPRLILTGKFNEGIEVLEAVREDAEDNCYEKAQFLINHYKKKYQKEK